MQNKTELDNYEIAIRDASENPWIILMTLHGELLDSNGYEKNVEIQSKNKNSWNILAKQMDPSLDFDIDVKIRNDFGSAEDSIKIFHQKTSNKCNIHDLFNSDRIDISHLLHINNFNISGFIFNKQVISRYCQYKSIIAIDTIFKREFRITFSKVDESAIFSDCNFKTDIIASHVTYSGNTALRRCMVGNLCDFSDSEFLGSFNAEMCQISGKSYFKKCKFHSIVNFQNAEFKGATQFQESEFLNNPPDFHEAKIHADTNWVDTKWPNPPDTKDLAVQHMHCYQRIKQIMENLKKHEDELDFFAHEMASRRIVDWHQKRYGRVALNWIYQNISDYGRSVWRPMSTMAVSFIGSAFCIAAWMSWGRLDWYKLPKFRNAIDLTLANFLAPLNFRKDFYDAEFLSALPSWIKILSVFQTISGLLFTFLIGLALRNRFRLK